MEYSLVAYDVQSNKARRSVTKLLENVGTRLQKSVFFVKANAKQLRDIEKAACEKLEEGDSFLIIPCCESCLQKAKFTEDRTATPPVHCAF